MNILEPNQRRVSPRLRESVLADAGRECQLCGAEATDADHIWPRALGGDTEWWNLQALCRSCNARKGDTFNVDELDEFKAATAAVHLHNVATRRFVEAVRWTSAHAVFETAGRTGSDAWAAYCADLDSELAARMLHALAERLGVDRELAEVVRDFSCEVAA